MRIIALFLSVLILSSGGPMTALAYYVEGQRQASAAVTGKDGSSIHPGEDWETRFPYGTFAFENSSVTVSKSSGTQRMKVYRLGGTTGRATAYITYVPAATENAETGERSYASAVSSSDVAIRVEDPLPIAEYQPVGKAPEPERAGVAPVKSDGDAEGSYYVLSLPGSVSGAASGCQWQVLFADTWRDIEDAASPSMEVDADEYNSGEYDFRCVYIKDDTSWATDSAKGVPYEKPADEALPSMPADLDLNPDPSYSPLELTAKGPYENWVFAVTFADGEYVKEILFDMPGTAAGAADKFAVLTITDTEGGTVTDAANTLMLHMQGDVDPAPSGLGFKVSDLRVDKAAGTAELIIERTGNMSKVLTLSWATEDGTARAGIDYVAASGEAVFYAARDSFTVKIDLIGTDAVSGGDKDFSVRLFNLRGDNNSSIDEDASVATVHLYNSGPQAVPNVVTQLYDAEAVDATGSVLLSSVSANASLPVLTGTQQEASSEIPATVEWEEPNELSPLSYSYGSLSFPSGGTSPEWTSQVSITNSAKWSGGSKVESTGAASSTYTDDKLALYFYRLNASFAWNASLGSDGTLFAYGLEYTYPYFYLLTSTGANYATSHASTTSGGGWWSGYTLSWYKTGYLDSSWSQTSDVNRLQLATHRYDSHDSKDNAKAQMTSGTLYRRSFNSRFSLKIDTPNDADTRPDSKAGMLPQGFYNNYFANGVGAHVTISNGGADSSGRVFVGSTVKVQLGVSSSFTGANDDPDNYSIFLTDSAGKVVAVGSKSGDSYTIQLDWGTSMNLSDSYTINLALKRSQSITVNLKPSAEERSDHTPDIGRALTLMRNSSTKNQKITVKYTQVGSRSGTTPGGVSYHVPTFTSGASLQSRDIPIPSTPTGDGFSLSPAVTGSNIQCINFNLSRDDMLLINGKSYAGNEDIWLAPEDLTSSNLTFYYYQKDFQSRATPMSATFDHTALYFDANGNGQIDGYWDPEAGFILTPVNGVSDTFIMNLDANSYEETIFAPTMIGGKAHQFFFKTFFTKNPRSLQPPTPQAAGDVCQILPAFITTVTNAASYSRLTEEQKNYRTITSGKTKVSHSAAVGYSSDNHLMYTARASSMSYVDIPLGGDTKPCAPKTDKSAYVWEPSFIGNLLYKYDNPAPIYIEHSLAGDNIPVAPNATFNAATGSYTLNTGDKDKLNGFLGAFGGNDTFSLIIRDQEKTTAEILSGLSTLADEKTGADSFNTGDPSATPDSSYLQNMNSEQQSPTGSDKGNNNYSEFSSDFGTSAGAFSFGVGDYFSLSTSGKEVSFSIGIPLAGYEKKVGETGEGTNPATQNKKNLTDTKEGVKKVKDFINSYDKTKKGLKKFDPTKLAGSDELSASKLKSGTFSASLSVQIGFVFTYNALDNAYYFSQAAITLTGSLSFRAQYRFTPLPIVYVYVQVGGSLSIATGLGVNRDVVEGTVSSYQDNTHTKGSAPFTFNTSKKAFNVTFSGKLLLEVFKADGITPYPDIQKGTLSSDGSDKTQVVLLAQKDMDLKHGDAVIKLTPLEDTTLTRFAPINEVYSDVYWSGVSFDISAYIEAGAGVGVEIAKFEVFVKIVVGFGFTLGAYNTDTHKYEPASFDQFNFKLGLGFRVVFLLFSFEMDLIEYHVNYEKGKGWSHGYGAFGGALGNDTGLGSLEDDSGGGVDVTVHLPGNYTYNQRFYRNVSTGGLEPQAVNTGAPFQVSGYGASSAAFPLFEGVSAGYDYKVVTVGNKNYLLYTISRDKDGSDNHLAAEDYSALALSRIKTTMTGTGLTYGLVNPTDESAATPYILVDNDDTGDLDFAGWETGGNLGIAWVSYKAKTAVSEPTLSKYKVGDVTISAANYATITPAANPGPAPTAPTAPNELDFYTTISKEAYDALDEAGKAACQAVNAGDPSEGYYQPASGYDTYANAKSAYDSAGIQYTADLNRYNTDLPAYEAKRIIYNSYTTWYNYYAALDTAANPAARSAEAAKNTCVKRAVFNTGSKNLVDRETVSPDGNYSFLPGGSGEKVLFFVQTASHYDSAELTAALAPYKAYLAGRRGTGPDDLPTSIVEYREKIETANLSTFGTGSKLAVSVKSGGNWLTTATALTGGQRVTNLEYTMLGTDYLVAYTTEKSLAHSGDWLTVTQLYLRKLTLSGDTPTWGNPVLVRTLYNYDQSSEKDGVYSGGTQQTPAYTDPYVSNLKFLTANLDSALLLSSGTGEEIHPLDVTRQTLLLFEMNGSTYLIDEPNLLSITSDLPSGKIYPFFIPAQLDNADGTGKTAQTFSGKAEVTIAADGEGALAALYTSIVPSTTNNALYISRYDAAANTWSEGNMLAMRSMSVYEAAQKNGWDNETAEAAYYAADMKQFVFGNLQAALGTGSAGGAGIDTLDFDALNPQSVSADGRTYTFDGETVTEKAALPSTALSRLSSGLSTLSDSDLNAQGASGELGVLSDDEMESLGLDPLDSAPTTLLIVSQGTLTELERRYVLDAHGQKILKEGSTTEYETMVVPKSNGSLGIYAVGYGFGSQKVGDLSLKLDRYDFAQGSRLFAQLSFRNTGDTAIRYSDSGTTKHPITAKLWVHTGGGDLPLGTWDITGNILPGQSVSLSGALTELTHDLAAGDYFFLSVSEDPAYFGGNTYSFSSKAGGSLLTVEEKPELGFEVADAFLKSIDSTAGTATLEVNFQISNRGSKTAEDTYVQFTYDTGVKNADGSPVFAPLDLTNSALKVSAQKQLETLALSSYPLDQGLLLLTGTDGSANINKLYQRTVTGTVTVPLARFCAGEAKALSIRAEAYSKSSDTHGWTAGVVNSAHSDEYNPDNNLAYVRLEQTTLISAATNITIPLGSTLRLPISFASTSGAPQLSAYEVADANGSELGILYYDGASAIVLAPARKGTGVLHIIDSATNSTRAVAYTVGEAGDGMNVNFDNTYFTFHDKTGATHAKADEYADWQFVTPGTWGTGSFAAAPYLLDLALGQKNAYLTFPTQADRLEFYFEGQLEIRVTDADGDPVALTDRRGAPISGAISASGGSCANRPEKGTDRDPTYAAVYFTNVNQQTYTVTVKVKSDRALIDAIAQFYPTGHVPTPSDDTEAPGIYWSRSFPGTASKATGSGTETLSVYLLDSTGLASVTLGSGAPAGLVKQSDTLWSFEIPVSANGSYTIRAVDMAGNATARVVTVDWFSNTPPAGTTDFAPDLSTGVYKNTVAGKTAVERATTISASENSAGAYISIEPASTDTSAALTVERYVYDSATKTGSFSPVTPESPGVYRATTNGVYRVTATHEDSDHSDPKHGTWRSSLVAVTAYDTSLPVVTLALAGLGQAAGADVLLAWSASKSAGGTIQSVSLNGTALYSAPSGAGQKTAVSGTWQAAYGAAYKLSVRDSAGNSVESALLSVHVPIGLTAADLAKTTGSFDQADGTGSILVNLGRITGGDNANASATATADYHGSYACAAVPVGEDYTGDRSDGTAFRAFLSGLTWTAAGHTGTAAIEHLSSGDYVLYVRDATADPALTNPNTLASMTLTVADEIVTITGTSTRSASTASSSANDGVIYVTAAGSGTGIYEFAVLPLTLDASASTPGKAVFTESYTAADFTDWHPASFAGGSPAAGALQNLSSGWYQIAGRTMYGVTASEISHLNALASALALAQAALVGIDGDIASDVRSASGQLTLLYSAYRTAVASGVQQEIDGAYAAYTGAFRGDPTVLAALNAFRTAEEASVAAYKSTGQIDQKLAQTADDARATYDAAVTTYYSGHYEGLYNRTAAQAARDNALNAYSAERARLQGLSAAAYTATPAYAGGVYTDCFVQLGHDTAVRFSAGSSDATYSASDGAVNVYGASGSSTGLYQFALVTPANGKTAYTLAALKGMTLYWRMADSAARPTAATFTGLAAGTYQVVVRPLYSVTTAQLEALDALAAAQSTMAAALAAAQAAAGERALQTQAARIGALLRAWDSANPADTTSTEAVAYLAAISSNIDVLSALAVWRAAADADKPAAQAAYNTALAACLAASATAALHAALHDYSSAETAYNAEYARLAALSQREYSETPGYFDNAQTQLVTVNIRSNYGGSGIASSATTGTPPVTTFRLREGRTLTSSDQNLIRSANQTADVRLVAGGLTVILPAGTLSAGDDVGALLPDLTSLTPGSALAFTDGVGNVRRAPLFRVEDGRLTFVAQTLGAYFLVADDSFFSDTMGHWGDAAALFAASRGLMVGTGGRRFSPDRPMTRAMLVTTLFRLAGQPAGSAGADFGDAEAGSWYEPALAWAAGEGIVSGIGGGLFGTNNPITRQDLVTILWRFVTRLGLDTSASSGLDGFDDSGDVADYAKEAMAWAVSTGLIGGTTKTTLSPGATATRAQVATLYMRLTGLVLDSMS